MADSSSKSGWTEGEKYQLLVQIIHQLTSSGGGPIKLNELNMPGRTPKSLSHMVAKIKAEAKAFSSAAASNPGATSSSAKSGAEASTGTGGGRGTGSGVKKRAPGGAAAARAKVKKQKMVERGEQEKNDDDDDDDEGGEFETKPAIKKERKVGMAEDVDEDFYSTGSADGEV